MNTRPAGLLLGFEPSRSLQDEAYSSIAESYNVLYLVVPPSNLSLRLLLFSTEADARAVAQDIVNFPLGKSFVQCIPYHSVAAWPACDSLKLAALPEERRFFLPDLDLSSSSFAPVPILERDEAFARQFDLVCSQLGLVPEPAESPESAPADDISLLEFVAELPTPSTSVPSPAAAAPTAQPPPLPDTKCSTPLQLVNHKIPPALPSHDSPSPTVERSLVPAVAFEHAPVPPLAATRTLEDSRRALSRLEAPETAHDDANIPPYTFPDTRTKRVSVRLSRVGGSKWDDKAWVREVLETSLGPGWMKHIVEAIVLVSSGPTYMLWVDWAESKSWSPHITRDWRVMDFQLNQYRLQKDWVADPRDSEWTKNDGYL